MMQGPTDRLAKILFSRLPYNADPDLSRWLMKSRNRIVAAIAQGLRADDPDSATDDGTYFLSDLYVDRRYLDGQRVIPTTEPIYTRAKPATENLWKAIRTWQQDTGLESLGALTVELQTQVFRTDALLALYRAFGDLSISETAPPNGPLRRHLPNPRRRTAYPSRSNPRGGLLFGDLYVDAVDPLGPFTEVVTERTPWENVSLRDRVYGLADDPGENLLAYRNLIQEHEDWQASAFQRMDDAMVAAYKKTRKVPPSWYDMEKNDFDMLELGPESVEMLEAYEYGYKAGRREVEKLRAQSRQRKRSKSPQASSDRGE